jgi:hypothetical protein
LKAAAILFISASGTINPRYLFCSEAESAEIGVSAGSQLKPSFSIIADISDAVGSFPFLFIFISVSEFGLSTSSSSRWSGYFMFELLAFLKEQSQIRTA